MFVLDRIAHFLITRAQSVVSYLKKFTKPSYIISFVIIYPYIYTNIINVISAAQQALVNLSDQFFNWIEATFWGIYNYIKDKLGNIWFGQQIAYIVAGLAMALPFIAYIIFRYAFTPLATTLLNVSLNILGIVFYIFCKVVIPALKYAYGAYLFAKFMPSSLKYANKALDRFAQGKALGALGALAAMLGPFAAFFAGPAVISAVTDQPCSLANAPLTIAQTYQVPYAPVVVSQYTLSPTMSWILATTYGGYYTSFLPYSLFYIYASLTQNVQQLISYSYITTSAVSSVSYPVVYGYYGGYYWYGYTIGGTTYWYGSLAQSLSDIYPYISYLIILGYLPYSMSYIFAYAFTVSPYVYPPPTYSFINVQVPIFSISLFDQTLITGPIELDVYLYDLSYIGSPTPNVSLYDLSYIGSPTPNVSLYDLSYVYNIPSDIPIVYIIDTSYIGSYPA
jgi:hypothetical protein